MELTPGFEPGTFSLPRKCSVDVISNGITYFALPGRLVEIERQHPASLVVYERTLDNLVVKPKQDWRSHWQSAPTGSITLAPLRQAEMSLDLVGPGGLDPPTSRL